MKVLLVNGSPHAKGSTYVALTEVAKSLKTQGIETEIFQLGTKAISGCLGCQYCRTHDKQCVLGDIVNDFNEKSSNYDGFVFGTPVHYAAASGALTSFMDRVFYSAGSLMANKPAATVIVCRRGGASAAFDQINKYYTINNMFIVGSNYWNSVHASTPDAITKDEEGLQTMRTLGVNMAWILKCIEAGKNAGIPQPKREDKIATVFAK
jgi:multimeric flavodoxin WrbA